MRCQGHSVCGFFPPGLIAIITIDSRFPHSSKLLRSRNHPNTVPGPSFYSTPLYRTAQEFACTLYSTVR